jgi:CRISPR-associated protein Csd2
MTETATAKLVDKRYDFVLLFDVTDGNPNGDPDSGNMPRVDPQTRQGLVTDVCMKRKIRNAMSLLGEDRPGYDIYFQTQDAVYEKRILNLQHQRAYDALGLTFAKQDKKAAKADGDPRSKADNTAKARDWMCQNFFDIRAFGAVMTTGVNCGQVRGPVQITFSRSIDPVLPLDYAITRKSVTTEDDAKKQASGDGSITGTIGRKDNIPYGLFRCSGFINPYLAKQTGFTTEDLGMLWQSLKGLIWEIDRSASRGLMCTRGLYVFEHASALGNAPAHELFDRISVEPLGDGVAPRTFSQYRDHIHVNVAKMPEGVTLQRMVEAAA